ncbi:TetR/AcrR family transcriptional regulator [Pontiella sp.]|uniref:TetR/AcrR family transcriptional regulator n=1 Tax=Pontiella sp. TaxID=2837462 RepID=UPI0035613C6A
MARAQFDRNEVLDKAIALFWQHGYSASSMQQVVKATGLQPGSIYLAFGNKEGLFREALERYSQKSLARIRETIDGAPSIGAGICRIFENNIEASLEQNYCSCFLVKTQLELAAENNDLHELAAKQLQGIEALFQSYLEQESDAELGRQRAISIMLHIFGMRVYGYQRDSADRILQGLRAGLPWLPWGP